MLTRLLYVSDINKDHALDMESLVEAAVRNNKANNITGVLWFTGKNFVQVLEGGRLTVSNTYNVISNDPRHKNVEIVSCEHVAKRLFTQWHMAFIGDSEKNREHVLRYSATDELHPERMPTESLLGILKDMTYIDV